jgi:DNA-binding NarL/FixJ family response regulator
MRPAKYRINLTGIEKSSLEQLLRRHSTPQNKARRAQIILLANEEAKTNKDIAKRLGVLVHRESDICPAKISW